jgi:translation initiation factor 3 subunit G
METKKIIINQEAIERRRKIKPFGDLERIKSIGEVETIIFNINNNNEIIDTTEKSEPAPIYKFVGVQKSEESTRTTPENIYVPPSLQNQSSISVKISNYPLDMTKEELIKLISQNSKIPFRNFHMVRDRETGLSRGYSFVTVENKEKASMLIKDLRSVVVDSLRLLGELSKSN